MKEGFAESNPKGVLSWIWGTITLSKLLITTKPLPAVADIVLDLTISVLAVLAIIYVASVSGPMQWWINHLSNTSKVIYAGGWETAGLVTLVVLL